MTNLQQLLEEKYPDSEISHIQREAFEEGYKAATQAGAELIRYENTLFFSIENQRDGEEGIANDFMLDGSAERLGSGLAAQMERHPELVEFLEYSLTLYDNLMRVKDYEEVNK